MLAQSYLQSPSQFRCQKVIPSKKSTTFLLLPWSWSSFTSIPSTTSTFNYSHFSVPALNLTRLTVLGTRGRMWRMHSGYGILIRSPHTVNSRNGTHEKQLKTESRHSASSRCFRPARWRAGSAAYHSTRFEEGQDAKVVPGTCTSTKFRIMQYRASHTNISFSQLIKNSQAFIIEESEVDPKSMTMVTRTKNLNHVRVMQIVETQIFRQHAENPEWTSCKSEACIVSRFGWGMAGKIELFGQSTFAKNASKVHFDCCCCCYYCILFIFYLQWAFIRLEKECVTSCRWFEKNKSVTECLSSIPNSNLPNCSPLSLVSKNTVNNVYFSPITHNSSPLSVSTIAICTVKS